MSNGWIAKYATLGLLGASLVGVFWGLLTMNREENDALHRP